MNTLRCGLAGLLLVLLQAAAPALAQLDATGELQPDSTTSAIVRIGFDHPAQAIAALARLRSTGGAPMSPARSHELLLAQGLVEAQAGHDIVAGVIADRLAGMSVDLGARIAGASAQLVRAVSADNAGQVEAAASAAEVAARGFSPDCPSSNEQHAPAAPACRHAALSKAWQIQARQALAAGDPNRARMLLQSAVSLAQWASDTPLQVDLLEELAEVGLQTNEKDLAERSAKQATTIAAGHEPATMVAVSLARARLAAAQGDRPREQRALEEALDMARAADLPRRMAGVMALLSDFRLAGKRPESALLLVEEALPTARRFRDHGLERHLIRTAGLAKIALRRTVEGKADLARLLNLSGEARSFEAIGAMSDFGEALSDAGDLQGALDLYHRERTLSAAAVKRSQDGVLKEMQVRYDAEAKQRSIELTRSDNAAKAAALANREVSQRIWFIAAGVLAASIVLVALLNARVRRANAQLEASQAQLHLATVRDPLTNLANRRHLLEVMHTNKADAPGLEGALLLVDIDHFKHVNDGFGHIAGDAVLVDVAQRMNAMVGARGLVVRWGGEEFLIHVPGMTQESTRELAARLLTAVGGRDIDRSAKPLRVTVSIGYACLPLAPSGISIGWEQAVNLCDLALYTAKSQGRNRAAGIAAVFAADANRLQAIEADFKLACEQGQVRLDVIEGPAQG